MSPKTSYRDLEAKVKALEKEIAGQKSIEKLLWNKQDQLFKVLDSLDAIVYVADMHSYEIIFANLHAEKLFGHVTGRICWQVLQSGMSGPCPFCRNNEIVTSDGKAGDIVVWELQNSINNRWYSVRDRAIDWFDGRIVHLQIAVIDNHFRVVPFVGSNESHGIGECDRSGIGLELESSANRFTIVA